MWKPRIFRGGGSYCQILCDENTKGVSKVIISLGSTLQAEKEALSRVCSTIQLANSELNIGIESKIEKLQSDLVVENNLMDKLAQKTEKSKVLTLMLNYDNKHLDDLESEKAVVKSCVLDVKHYLHRLVETRDSLLSVSVR